MHKLLKALRGKFRLGHSDGQRDAEHHYREADESGLFEETHIPSLYHPRLAEGLAAISHCADIIRGVWVEVRDESPVSYVCP